MSANSIRLVAAREVRERVRTRAFRISTAVAMAVVALAVLAPRFEGNPLQANVKVGVVERAPEDVEQALALFGEAGFSGSLEVESVATRETAERALRDGSLQVAVIGKSEILMERPLEHADISGKARVARFLASLGAVSRMPTPVSGVLPPRERELGSPVSAVFGAFLIYIFLVVYGSQILSGVTEEKSSRVVEILLAAVPPRTLLYGKVLGLGAVALLQGGMIGGLAALVYQLSGQGIASGQTGGQVMSTLGWFLVAYAFYAFAYASAGATISRQEESSSVAFPLTLPLLIAYVAAISALGGEDNTFLTVLSFLPPTAPIAMPVRASMGFASGLDVLASVALTVGGTVVMARLAGVVYERSILRLGSRTSLRALVKG